MRKTFARLTREALRQSQDTYLLVGDLGFGLFNDFKQEFPNQYFNVGSAEQLLVGMGIGLTQSDKIAVCYSISPFVLYRPFELIRNYLYHEGAPVKLVGSGRNRDYGHDGFSHWAEEDELVFRAFPNIVIYKPETTEQLESIFPEFLLSKVPSYLNLQK